MKSFKRISQITTFMVFFVCALNLHYVLILFLSDLSSDLAYTVMNTPEISVAVSRLTSLGPDVTSQVLSDLVNMETFYVSLGLHRRCLCHKACCCFCVSGYVCPHLNCLCEQCIIKWKQFFISEKDIHVYICKPVWIVYLVSRCRFSELLIKH